jgi:hypothetical protein
VRRVRPTPNVERKAAQRPTLLAKIFGVYKIAYKNPILGKVVRMNLLVMENLFYGRRFTRVRSFISRRITLMLRSDL